ncbi:sigma-70 family RNA polymerase sigma factor [Tessaracoccus sp.]
MRASEHDHWFTQLAQQEKLLTREQEVELAVQIEAGVLAQDRLNTSDSLTAGDTAALHLLVDQGATARERFVLANVRLARHWAGRRFRAGSVGTLDLDDLTSEGIRAVVHAVEMFDHTVGVKFSTYASFWIRQYQARAVAKSLRLTFTIDDLKRVQEYLIWSDEFKATQFVTPTLADVRTGMGLTARAATDIMTMVNFTGTMKSLDSPVQPGEHAQYGDLLASHDPGPEQVAMTNADHDILASALGCLTARERAVVTARTGWDGDAPMGAGQVAHQFGVSILQVRVVTRTAMAKLRAELTGTHQANRANRATRPNLTAVDPHVLLVTMTTDLSSCRAA